MALHKNFDAVFWLWCLRPKIWLKDRHIHRHIHSSRDIKKKKSNKCKLKSTLKWIDRHASR